MKGFNGSVRYASMNLSSTLSRNEKVEQHIRRKNIHKLNVLRFWVKGGVILLCGVARFSLFEIFPVLSLYWKFHWRKFQTPLSLKGEIC